MHNLRNTNIGRQLDLESLQNAKNKVTVGFKTNATTKMRLIEEANELELTLSEYIDMMVVERDNEYQEIQKVIVALNYYEKNNILISYFNKYKGQHVKFKNNGQEVSKEILSIKDIFDVIINSFQ